jgi:hypothetical protein
MVSNPKKECFICCSDLSEQNFNRFSYPLLSMADAFNCNCVNNYAHNKCLININKCPTCRKESVPNLYVYTKYDYYFSPLLNWLKNDISRIEKINWFILYYLMFLYCIVLILHCNKNLVNTLISYCKMLLFFTIMITFTIYILTIFNDYLKKYWLYDFKQQKCHIFNKEYIIIPNHTIEHRILEHRILHLTMIYRDS